MFDLTRRAFTLASAAFLTAGAALAGPAPQESAYFQDAVAAGDLPPVADRLPAEPLVVDLEAKGRAFGTQGGALRTMVSRSKDIRQMVVYGYARLVGYDENYLLVPDILLSYENEDDRKFTLRLREGHKWSDGHPLTSADFAYWWNDVANNPKLSPVGPPDFMIVDGKPPVVSFPDAYTIVYEWEAANAGFLATLAQASPPFIYRPAHFLKTYHADYADADDLAAVVDEARVNSWAALHNKLDNMYKFDNAELPTLQPWINASSGKKLRNIFTRNPYYHRVDTRGVQLPYIDQVEMEIVSGGLVAAKANAGETDLQSRGLDFRNISILRKGEADGGNYRTYLWGSGVASQIAIYPNLNYADDGWRAVMRDVRFRRALSLGINRKGINHALYFKLAKPGAMSVLPKSPFFKEEYRAAWSDYDLDQANALLDDMGLTQRDGDGLRLLPDGRPMEFIIETAGERQEVENALQIVTDSWRELGIKLIMRPLDRDILRNRIYAGETMAAVWFGWDNGLPQLTTSPAYLAPTDQVFFAWPKWGQHYQTRGAAGEAPDLPEAQRLMELHAAWNKVTETEAREVIWHEMLAIHADQLYGIGILNEAPQPVVVNNKLKNVPEKGIWAWDPGAHFGVHRMDEFYFEGGSN